MKTIILHGHASTVQAAYMQLDALLNDRKPNDIVLMQACRIDQATAHALRDGGGELWYCGSSLTQPRGTCSPSDSDRTLLAATFEELAPKVLSALNEFMGKTRVAA